MKKESCNSTAGEEMKLTKNEKRFSESDRPSIGSIVEFLPLIFLSLTEGIPDKRTFINSYIVRGARCKVVENTKHLTTVRFLKNQSNETDVVSPSFLVSRELTELGEKVMEMRNEH